MKLIFVLMTLFVSLSAQAFPNKYQGFCQEVGSTKKSAVNVGLDFKDFPNSLTVLDQNGKATTAFVNAPTRTSPGVDRYVILEEIATEAPPNFSILYYGNIYTSTGPYFYEMRVRYDLDVSGALKTHQLQTTYFQGQVTLGNEWNCEYQQY